MAKMKRLNIEYPYDEFVRLKTVCMHLDMTMKDFLTWKIMKNVKEQEEKLGLKRKEEEK